MKSPSQYLSYSLKTILELKKKKNKGDGYKQTHDHNTGQEKEIDVGQYWRKSCDKPGQRIQKQRHHFCPQMSI